MLLIGASNLSFSQTKEMKGLMGISFGATKAEVKSIIQSKQPTIKIDNEKAETITYKGLMFGGRKTFATVFKFTDNGKFHTAVMLIDPDLPTKTYDLYDEIVSDINEKYYSCTHTVEKYKYPFDKSDRDNMSALKGGYVTMYSLWYFDNLNTPDNESDDNAILVEVLPSYLIKVSYQDGVLIDEVVAKQKQQNSSDY